MNIFLISALVALAVFCVYMMTFWDIRARLIPDIYLFPFLLIGLLVCDNFSWIPGGIGESVIAGAIGYTVGFVVNFAFKLIKKTKNTDHDPIGMGDIKLLAAGGIWLGVSGLSIALVAACIFGVIWGILKKQKYVPFAPFFFAGGVIAISYLMLIQ